MKKAFFVTLNEVKLFLVDKGDMAFSLLLPVLTFALMYGAFGGDTLFKATASIVNEDNGTYAQQLIQKIDDVDGVSVKTITAEEANSDLDRSDLLFAVFIPDGFSDTLAAGGQAELIFKQRGNGGTEGQILASIVSSAAEDINQEFQVRAQVKTALAGTGIADSAIEVTVQDILEQEKQQPPVTVKEEITGGNSNFVPRYMPGIITMYVLWSLSMMATTIVEERRRGTLERLLTTHLNVNGLLVGKWLAAITRGLIQILVLMILGWAVFQVFTPLSFLECVVVSVVFGGAAASLGMIIAAIARTMTAANLIAVIITMFMVMMGGTFFSISEGSVMEVLSKVSINTYANQAYTTLISKSGSLTDVWSQLVVLAGVAIIGFFISRLIFKAVPGSK